MKYIVAGIGTDVGKTIVSAILVKTLQADYWKPIQAGSLDATDSMRIRELTNFEPVCHSESYRLRYPASPHLAARMENITVDPLAISLPETKNSLVIEMAGGILSPLNDRSTQSDLFSAWDCRWILVSRHYLGSINHTLLSLSYLKMKKIPLAGIVFNGEANPSSEEFILQYANVPCLARLKHEKILDSTTIAKYAEEWKEAFRCAT